MRQKFLPNDKIKAILFLLITLLVLGFYVFGINSKDDEPLKSFENEFEKNISKMLSKIATRDLLHGECNSLKRIGGNTQFSHLAKNKDSLYR